MATAHLPAEAPGLEIDLLDVLRLALEDQLDGLDAPGLAGVDLGAGHPEHGRHQVDVDAAETAGGGADLLVPDLEKTPPELEVGGDEIAVEIAGEGQRTRARGPAADVGEERRELPWVAGELLRQPPQAAALGLVVELAPPAEDHVLDLGPHQLVLVLGAGVGGQIGAIQDINLAEKVLGGLRSEDVHEPGLDLDQLAAELLAAEIQRPHLGVELLRRDVPGQDPAPADGDADIGVLDVGERLRALRPLGLGEELPGLIGDRRRLLLRHRGDRAENQQKKPDEFQDPTARVYHSHRSL